MSGTCTVLNGIFSGSRRPISAYPIGHNTQARLSRRSLDRPEPRPQGGVLLLYVCGDGPHNWHCVRLEVLASDGGGGAGVAHVGVELGGEVVLPAEKCGIRFRESTCSPQAAVVSCKMICILVRICLYMHHCSLLIVDDDPAWLRVAVKYFVSYDYSVVSAQSSASGFVAYESHKPDCVLLDYNLADSDAEAFCRKIRSAEVLVRVPIVVISGEDGKEMQAYSSCQADAFVLKGSFDKARAVVETVMRRVRWERGVICLGDIRLEKKEFSVYRNRKLIANLSPKQFSLLSLLMCESPEFVSEDTIALHVFESDFAPDKTEAIKALVYRLRQLLGPQLGRRIKNKRDYGWIYVPSRVREIKSVPNSKVVSPQL